MKRIRILFILLTTALPRKLRASLLRLVFGWQIDASASIGLSIIDVDQLIMGSNSRIGHFTVFRDMQKVEIGHRVKIGQWNWFSAASVLIDGLERSDVGVLRVGDHSSITSRHYVDCSGGVHIGSYSTIAGVRSTILSHQIDFGASEQTLRPVHIGDYCFIGSDARMAPGAQVPNRCITAMGAVIVGSLPETDALYGGVPARLIKRIEDAAYFTRKDGIVRIRAQESPSLFTR